MPLSRPKVNNSFRVPTCFLVDEIGKNGSSAAISLRLIVIISTLYLKTINVAYHTIIYLILALNITIAGISSLSRIRVDEQLETPS